MDINRFELISAADKIGETIWNEVMQWKFFEKDTIGKQLVRSSDSISANLSEAYGRFTYAERIRFCYYSRGSLSERVNWIEKAKSRKLISQNTAAILLSEIYHLWKRINAYIKSLKSKLNNQ